MFTITFDGNSVAYKLAREETPDKHLFVSPSHTYAKRDFVTVSRKLPIVGSFPTIRYGVKTTVDHDSIENGGALIRSNVIESSLSLAASLTPDELEADIDKHIAVLESLKALALTGFLPSQE
jgi:hypothetical protein